MDKLIIAPHVDDDILGCGGIMDEDTFVLYCGLNESDIPDRPSLQTRLKEADNVAEYLGHKYHLLENRVNQYSIPDLIGPIEDFINEIKPNEVYIPYPSYNQDHRIVYEASIIALRPHDKNFFVNKVLVYEQPHVFLWDQTHQINGAFKPNCYRAINIKRKIKAYKSMKTQVRDFRSPDILERMASLRGSQSRCKYSEAFQIIRWVIK
jgi:LmbE family N-acetylglucosaminyl deacetylase